MTATPWRGASMREIASWIRRSPDFAATASSGRAIADMVGNVASQGRTPHQTQSRVEELVNADRRKDEFMAMLGHELRSPLGAINSAAALLRSEQGETSARRRAH